MIFKRFGLEKHNTSVKQEFIAGLTTFFCHALYYSGKCDYCKSVGDAF